MVVIEEEDDVDEPRERVIAEVATLAQSTLMSKAPSHSGYSSISAVAGPLMASERERREGSGKTRFLVKGHKVSEVRSHARWREPTTQPSEASE